MSSELFYKLGFTVIIMIIVIGMIVCLCTLHVLLIHHRRRRTAYHLLICDLCVSLLVHFILCFIRSIYGLRNDWQSYQPGCVLRAYLGMVTSAACIYSFSIQAISRLFFALFYTRRSLLSLRTHWILIVLKWCACFSVSCRPLFITDGFLFIPDVRICGYSLALPVALYSNVALFVLPLNIIVIVYGIIFYQIRRARRRIASSVITICTVHPASTVLSKKHLRVVRNILALISILCVGGLSHLVVLIWAKEQRSSLPKYLMFWSSNWISISTTMMTIVLLVREKQIKTIVLRYFREHCGNPYVS